MDVPRAYNLRRRRTPLQHAKWLVLNGSPVAGFQQLEALLTDVPAEHGEPHTRLLLERDLSEIAQILRARLHAAGGQLPERFEQSAALAARDFDAAVAQLWRTEELMVERGLVIDEAALDMLIRDVKTTGDTLRRAATMIRFGNPELVEPPHPAELPEIIENVNEFEVREERRAEGVTLAQERQAGAAISKRLPRGAGNLEDVD